MGKTRPEAREVKRIHGDEPPVATGLHVAAKAADGNTLSAPPVASTVWSVIRITSGAARVAASGEKGL